jgi:hypothetical protein
VVRVGTSKGSTISQHGCSTSGALATGALQKERKRAGAVRVSKMYLSVRFGDFSQNKLLLSKTFAPLFDVVFNFGVL